MVPKRTTVFIFIIEKSKKKKKNEESNEKFFCARIYKDLCKDYTLVRSIYAKRKIIIILIIEI